MGIKQRKGKKGTAVNYLTRGAALNKLQVDLKTFRRLCILKGIHPREPRKKIHGSDKTYYHAKDIRWLMHEPLLNVFSQSAIFERKIRRAITRRNFVEARRISARKPGCRVDHLIKERYPSFADALRDLDDPLTLVHLFSTLPSSNSRTMSIQDHVVAASKRLSMEFDAYIVKTHSLRKVFVSVRGFYYQAEVMGHNVTWLSPHKVQQVLPRNIDYTILNTFMEFYRTFLRFVNFKLYSSTGLKYPPSFNQELDKQAVYLESIMSEFSKPIIEKEKEDNAGSGLSTAEVKERLAGIQDKIKEITEEMPGEDGEEEESSGSELEEISSDDDADVNNITTIEDTKVEDVEMDEGGSVKQNEIDEEEDKRDQEMDEKEVVGEKAAGATASVPVDDEAALCERLFRGLVFFLGRECPMEPLLFVIKSFGGSVGWMGEGSPFERYDESITHEICDRPKIQGELVDLRSYIQPQWVFDSCNARVLLPIEPYHPGKALPPHLSPFVDDDEEGYIPDYAKTIRSIQEAANMVRKTMSTPAAATAENAGGKDLELEQQTEIEKAEAQEKAYMDELAQEVSTSGKQGDGSQGKQKKQRQRTAKDVANESKAMSEIMIPRKDRFLYKKIKSSEEERAANIERLSKRRDAMKSGVQHTTETEESIVRQELLRAGDEEPAIGQQKMTGKRSATEPAAAAPGGTSKKPRKKKDASKAAKKKIRKH